MIKRCLCLKFEINVEKKHLGYFFLFLVLVGSLVVLATVPNPGHPLDDIEGWDNICTGTNVFDWKIPLEWNIQDAYVKNSKGEKIIDFKKSNLHILNYSKPISKKISKKELKLHLHTIPEKPDSIPYVTSYYKKEWGFCTKHSQLKSINDDFYHVKIDSTLKKGNLTT